MANYRLYRLDGAGRISGAAELIVADSDEQAIADALDRGLHRGEIWQGRRLVGTIPGAS